MKIIVIIIISIMAIIIFFKLLSSEKERIKTLFRIYRYYKKKYPTLSERNLLEAVIEQHIPPGKAIRLISTGTTGKQYINGVFGSEEIDIDRLVYHIITLEFPKKYKLSLSLEE